MNQHERKGNRRKNGRRNGYTFQILWIVVLLIATVGILIGYKLGGGSNREDGKDVVNANGTDITEFMTPTPEPTTEPTATPTVTPTPEPTATPTVTPTPEPTATPTPDPDQKMVALTFDDGPYPPVTERLLKLLKDNDSHATFFVMGDRMDEYADTVKQEYEDGNQIGNHTLNHKDLTKLTAKEIKQQVEGSNKLINKNAPVGDAFLRPPYGAKSDKVRESVKVPLIFWSVDSLDWKTRNADSIYDEIMGTVKDGDIILMHDLYPTTADAMERVIPDLIAQGYKLVTVEELLTTKGITPEAGTVYYNARQ